MRFKQQTVCFLTSLYRVFFFEKKKQKKTKPSINKIFTLLKIKLTAVKQDFGYIGVNSKFP